MNKGFNKDIQQLKQSDIRRMTIECNKHPFGINLSQGVCDLDLPMVLINGVNQAVREGFNTYTRYDGLDDLREAVSRKMKNFNGISYQAETEIVVTSGSSAAFFLSLFLLKQGNDEIILFQPFYSYHYNTILALGMTPVVLDLHPETEWGIDFKELEERITDNTRAILINTPSNPSGKVFSESEIMILGQIARKHQLYLITDEIYEYITYDNVRHISPAIYQDFNERVITIGGFSKTFSITGWRLGYICASSDLIRQIGVLNDLFYICAPAPLQKAVSYALKMEQSYFNNLKFFYQKNRDLLVENLIKIGFKVILPKGAYYLLADVTPLGFSDSQQATEVILQKTGVAVVPGATFYEINHPDGRRFVRFCFAKKFDVLKKACDQLKKL